jgi:predicted acetyltransferase
VAIEIRVPEQGELAPMSAVDSRAFSQPRRPGDDESASAVIEPSRFRVAVDGVEMVGVAGSFALDLTVPGGGAVAMGGVTWVSVAATHRRQGLLRGLLQAVHADIDERGEPCAGLTASEGAIYGRFGYGEASRFCKVTIDPSTVRFRADCTPPPGTVRYLDPDDAKGRLPDLWEQHRRGTPGETSRSSARWGNVFRDFEAGDGFTEAFFLAHRDGYAAYRARGRWEDGHPAHEVEILELVALTPEAHLALWHTLLHVDLVRTVTSTSVPLDDPLPLLLENPRAMRVSAIRDYLWLRPSHPDALLAARTYAVEDRVVIEVHDEEAKTKPACWELDCGPAGASVTRTRRRPDVVLGRAGLGSIALGDRSASYLARGGRVEERTAHALRRVDLLFSVDRLPFSQNPF